MSFRGSVTFYNFHKSLQSGEVKPAVSRGDKNFTRAIKIGASYEDGFRNFLETGV